MNNDTQNTDKSSNQEEHKDVRIELPSLSLRPQVRLNTTKGGETT